MLFSGQNQQGKALWIFEERLTLFAMPVYSPEGFWILALQEFGIKEDRASRSFFGTSTDVCSLIWDWCSGHRRRPARGMKPIHVLWALRFLKSYDTEDIMSTWAKTTRKTWRKWVWIMLRLIRKMKKNLVCHIVIVFLLFCSRRTRLTKAHSLHTDKVGQSQIKWWLRLPLLHGLGGWY